MDPLEETLPDVGRVTLEDAETGEQYEVNTSDRAAQAGFRRAVADARAGLETVFRKHGVDHIALRTGEDYLPPLRKFFRERERRITHR